MRRFYQLFLGFVCTITIVSLLYFVRFYYQPMLREPQAPVIVTIDKSTSAASFVTLLKKKQLVAADTLLLYWIRIFGLSARLKAGIYQVHVGESAPQFLRRVVTGDVLTENFRIIEGTTQRQIAEHLEKSLYLIYKEEDWLMVAEGFPSAEGLLLAETYHYDAGSDSRNLLLRAKTSLLQSLQVSWQHRCSGLPYQSSYELLIVASLLEKEAAIASEKRLISGVIVNRLRRHMLLQIDPTVIYALGVHYQGKLTRQDLQIDSPFNTYRYPGLPPTPIAMVGKDALEAAAHPVMTDYLYYVAKGDGSHHFSKTYEEQKQAIQRFLRNHP